MNSNLSFVASRFDSSTSTQQLFAQAAASADPLLPSATFMSPSLTNLAVKRILQATIPQRTTPLVPRPPTARKRPASLSASVPRADDDALPPLLDGDESNDDSDDEDDQPRPPRRKPRLSASTNPQFFAKSAMGKAWQAQKNQKFGKDNLLQSFTTEPAFFHIVLPVLKHGFLAPEDIRNLSRACRPVGKLWHEYLRVKDIDWSPLCAPNPHWQTQERIDPIRVDMRTAMLFHYDMDLAAVQRRIGGNHVGAHRDHGALLRRVQHLLPPKLFDELRRVLNDGSPARFNVEGTQKEFREMLAYGNHPTVEKNLDKVMKTMNKEDRKDHVLTFPAWLAPFIPHLMLSPNGFVIKRGKNDRLVFDASFMLHPLSRPFNNFIDLDDEPDIIFGDSWIRFLIAIYNLRITFPDLEIYLFDDDVASAFRQLKYHPNVISAKGILIDALLFIATGLTFGDRSSPPSFETIARTRMAISTELAKGTHPVPEFPEYLDHVRFTPPPLPGTTFARARADRYNSGAPSSSDGLLPSVAYNMHVDDNLYAAAGVEHMRWAMRSSIAGLQTIMGPNEPELRPCQPDLEKFLKEPVSYERRQLGYITNTRTMLVTIPDDKRNEVLMLLRNNWSSGSRRYTFRLREAAEVLGLLTYLCRVCPWGHFLFQNLYQAVAHALERNTLRIMHDPNLRALVAQRDCHRPHPTDSAKYRFFSHKVARAIYDSKERTYLTPDIRQEVDFIIEVLSKPTIYRWGAPIAHLIPREHDAETHQDACPQGAGGFSSDLDYWWTVVWPASIVARTQLLSTDKHYISNNLLEYAALLIGLAGAITSWEALPANTRPEHPLVLLWTDNITARAWTRKVSGIKSPQGRALARILAHLLMFSDLGIESEHIAGIENVVADYLSRLAITHDPSSFTYHDLQTRFPWLKLSRRYVPSSELLALVCTALSSASVSIPITRVPLGQLSAAPPTSKQTFFGLPN